jgi:hypothetical protein
MAEPIERHVPSCAQFSAIYFDVRIVKHNAVQPIMIAARDYRHRTGRPLRCRGMEAAAPDITPSRLTPPGRQSIVHALPPPGAVVPTH